MTNLFTNKKLRDYIPKQNYSSIEEKLINYNLINPMVLEYIWNDFSDSEQVLTCSLFLENFINNPKLLVEFYRDKKERVNCLLLEESNLSNVIDLGFMAQLVSLELSAKNIIRDSKLKFRNEDIECPSFLIVDLSVFQTIITSLDYETKDLLMFCIKECDLVAFMNLDLYKNVEFIKDKDILMQALISRIQTFKPNIVTLSRYAILKKNKDVPSVITNEVFKFKKVPETKGKSLI